MEYFPEKIGNRIIEERKRLKLSQAELGERIGTSGKQISNYESGRTLPPLDNLLLLCRAFDCELGYLLGEDDYAEKTRLDTAIVETTGLSPESIESIRRITGTGKESPCFGNESALYRKIMNNLISSSGFSQVVECLAELDRCRERIREARKVSCDDGSIELYKKTVLTGPDANDLSEEQIEALSEIDQAVDKQHDLKYAEKVFRYELHDALINMINELYPKSQN